MSIPIPDEVPNQDLDAIFIVFKNSDMTEGKGPMILDNDAGFFTDEDTAWKYVDTKPGVMGSKPKRVSWKNHTYGDWQVRKILKHNSHKHIEMDKIKKEISELKERLKRLEGE